jgi:hypothetical protein
MNRRKVHNFLTAFAELMAKRELSATAGNGASVLEVVSVELLCTTVFVCGLGFCQRHERRLHEWRDR